MLVLFVSVMQSGLNVGLGGGVVFSFTILEGPDVDGKFYLNLSTDLWVGIKDRCPCVAGLCSYTEGWHDCVLVVMFLYGSSCRYMIMVDVARVYIQNFLAGLGLSSWRLVGSQASMLA